MRISDWSSDVCSSDLLGEAEAFDLEEVWPYLERGDVVGGARHDRFVRQVLGVIVDLGRFADPRLDLGLLRPKRPGEIGRHVAVEPYMDRGAGISGLGAERPLHLEIGIA